MNKERLISILNRYPDNTEIFVSYGDPDDNREISALMGVREGELVEGVKSIKHDSKRSIVDPNALRESVAIILAY